MKKILLIIFCIMLNLSVCSAKNITAESAAIGGISTGATGEYIKSIYGEPNRIKFNKDKTVETWYYGDTFQISLINDVVTSIISSGNNGLTTPEGIGVGMKKRSVTSKYGKPQSKEKFDKRAIYIYNVDNGTKMYFVINGKFISEIRLLND